MGTIVLSTCTKAHISHKYQIARQATDGRNRGPWSLLNIRPLHRKVTFSYDRAKMKKSALTWLIFAGLVIYIHMRMCIRTAIYMHMHMMTIMYKYHKRVVKVLLSSIRFHNSIVFLSRALLPYSTKYSTTINFAFLLIVLLP